MSADFVKGWILGLAAGSLTAMSVWIVLDLLR